MNEMQNLLVNEDGERDNIVFSGWEEAFGLILWECFEVFWNGGWKNSNICNVLRRRLFVMVEYNMFANCSKLRKLSCFVLSKMLKQTVFLA